jgi:hypothetical protein
VRVALGGGAATSGGVGGAGSGRGGAAGARAAEGGGAAAAGAASSSEGRKTGATAPFAIVSAYTRARGVPLATRACASARTSSIRVRKASIGCAPRRLRPLMKNEGVPEAPSERARAWFASIAARWL